MARRKPEPSPQHVLDSLNSWTSTIDQALRVDESLNTVARTQVDSAAYGQWFGSHHTFHDGLLNNFFAVSMLTPALRESLQSAIDRGESAIPENAMQTLRILAQGAMLGSASDKGRELPLLGRTETIKESLDRRMKELKAEFKGDKPLKEGIDALDAQWRALKMQTNAFEKVAQAALGEQNSRHRG